MGLQTGSLDGGASDFANARDQVDVVDKALMLLEPPTKSTITLL